MNKIYDLMALTLLVLAIICIIYNQNFTQPKEQQPSNVNQETLQKLSQQQDPLKYYPPIETENTALKIKVNYPDSLSWKTKKEIYEIRKKYIERSIFNNPNYEPSEEVFGQITDRKPWVSNYICYEKGKDYLPTSGASEESRFINNPTALIALEYPFWFYDVKDTTFCNTSLSTLIPLSITYNGLQKEITVKYQKLPFSTKGNNTFYQFNGLNARDLGYKYIYLDKEKTTYDIEFKSDTNISKEVFELNNFIHLGSSCKVKGGCNNGSPRQEFVEFKNDTPDKEKGKIIYLKLWKENPKTPTQPADITEKIIFQE